jgi:hypothetical protein
MLALKIAAEKVVASLADIAPAPAAVVDHLLQSFYRYPPCSHTYCHCCCCCWYLYYISTVLKGPSTLPKQQLQVQHTPLATPQLHQP